MLPLASLPPGQIGTRAAEWEKLAERLRSLPPEAQKDPDIQAALKQAREVLAKVAASAKTPSAK